MKYTTTLYESVNAVPAEAWDAVCGPAADPFMDRRFLEAVERSMAADGDFQYVIIRGPAGEPVGCAALCLYRVDGAVLAGGWLRRIVQGIRRIWGNYLRFRVLFCGLPVSAGQKSLCLHPAANPIAAVAALDAALADLARRARVWLIVAKEFAEGDLAQVASLTARGYLRGDSLPMNHFEPRFRDLEHFCRALRSRYRSHITRSLRKFAQAGLRVEHLAEPERILAVYSGDVHRLYEAVVARARHKLEVLPAEFFRQLVQQLPGEVSLSVIWQDQRIRAFAWGLFHASIYHILFVGIDYSLNAEADLYFSTMLHSLDLGLRKGATDIVVGQTADEFKARLGCYQRPRVLYLKATNRLLHWVIGRTARLVFPPAPLAPRRNLFNPTDAGQTVAISG
jgi:predicted N-acyltransferase